MSAASIDCAPPCPASGRAELQEQALGGEAGAAAVALRGQAQDSQAANLAHILAQPGVLSAWSAALHSVQVSWECPWSPATLQSLRFSRAVSLLSSQVKVSTEQGRAQRLAVRCGLRGAPPGKCWDQNEKLDFGSGLSSRRGVACSDPLVF